MAVHDFQGHFQSLRSTPAYIDIHFRLRSQLEQPFIEYLVAKLVFCQITGKICRLRSSRSHRSTCTAQHLIYKTDSLARLVQFIIHIRHQEQKVGITVQDDIVIALLRLTVKIDLLFPQRPSCMVAYRRRKLPHQVYHLLFSGSRIQSIELLLQGSKLLYRRIGRIRHLVIRDGLST